MVAADSLTPLTPGSCNRQCINLLGYLLTRDASLRTDEVVAAYGLKAI